jgi:hypothetical protein
MNDARGAYGGRPTGEDGFWHCGIRCARETAPDQLCTNIKRLFTRLTAFAENQPRRLERAEDSDMLETSQSKVLSHTVGDLSRLEN